MKPTELVSATMLERYKIEGQIPWYSPAIEILADGTILVAYILQDARGSDVLDGLRIRHLDHNGNDLAPVVTILDTEAPRPPYQLLDPFHAMAVSAQRVAGNTVSLRVTNFGYRGTSVQDPDSLYGGPYYEVIYTVTCADGDMVVDGEAVVIDPIPSTILRY